MRALEIIGGLVVAFFLAMGLINYARAWDAKLAGKPDQDEPTVKPTKEKKRVQ